MKWPYVFLLVWLSTSGLLAKDTPSNSPVTAPEIKLSGYGYYMFGQVVSGVKADGWVTPTTTLNHLWSNTILIHLSATSNVTDWFTTKFGFEVYALSYYPSIGGAVNKGTYFRNFQVYITSAEGIMHWDFDIPLLSSLKISTGMLPYTINPEVKTLGNYLFRSTIHPVSVQNKVDYPWADLLGGVAEIGLLQNKVTFEAIIASEFNYVPFFDFTPAFGLYYKPNDIIDIGGTIAFHHAIPAITSLIPDSVDIGQWQGTKLDFRAIFDPKPIFGGMNFLGKDQFKIYAELAFLGLEDKLEVDTNNLAVLRTSDWDTTTLKTLKFPENSILHRMPFMIGINLPTWKILDCLNVELEWFYSPYANDWFGLFDSQLAEARQPYTLKHWDNYINQDNFKWSIHCRKSIGNFEARTFFGSDHTIQKTGNLPMGNFEQTMKRKGDWQWYIQLRYNL